MKRTKEPSEKTEFGLPGIGIPAEILIHPKLSSTEKLLFGLIKNLSYTEKGCWATNNWLGGMLGVKGQTISNGVAQLECYGFIHVSYSRRSNGNEKRTILINFGYQYTYNDMVQQAYQNINKGVLKNLYTHIKKLIPPYKNIYNDKDSNKDNNKDNKNIMSDKKLLEVDSPEYTINSDTHWKEGQPIDYKSFIEYFNNTTGAQCRMSDGKKGDIKKQVKVFTGLEIKKALKTRSISLKDNEYLTSWESIFTRKIEKMEKYLNMNPSKAGSNGHSKPVNGYMGTWKQQSPTIEM